MCLEFASDNRIVLPEQVHVTVIAELLRLGDRAAHIGEDDRSQGRRSVCSAHRMIRHESEEVVQRRRRIELQNGAGQQAVRFSVHRLYGLLARPFGKTEH
jgi:hypothetical protein